MTRTLLTKIPIHPAAFAAAFVLTRYLETGEYVTVFWRALAVAVGVAVALQLAAGAALRSRHLGAALATAGLAVLLDPIVGLLLILAMVGPTFATALRTRRVIPIDWARTSAFLGVIALLVLAIGSGLVAQRAATGALPGSAPNPAGGPGAPDIYVLLLDEYPRADTLATLGFDNGPFLESLENAGFDVAANSHSNYNATILTLTSMFNGQHILPLLGLEPHGVVSTAVLQRRLNQGRAIDWLAEAGYEVVSVPSGVSTDELRRAHRVIDTGQVSTFEVSVLRAGFLPRIFPGEQAGWLFAQQRERIEAQLDALAELPAEGAHRARFVFAHVMAPHAPWVFNADGSSREPPPCVPATCNMWDGLREPNPAAAIGQIQHLNDLVLDAVGRIKANSQFPPVIVVMSDHGGRYDPANDEEMLRNLFVAATPGRPGLFPDDVTPINLVPRLLNAYAGKTLPLASEESYVTNLEGVNERGWLPLTPRPQT